MPADKTSQEDASKKRIAKALPELQAAITTDSQKTLLELKKTVSSHLEKALLKNLAEKTLTRDDLKYIINHRSETIIIPFKVVENIALAYLNAKSGLTCDKDIAFRLFQFLAKNNKGSHLSHYHYAYYSFYGLPPEHKKNIDTAKQHSTIALEIAARSLETRADISTYALELLDAEIAYASRDFKGALEIFPSTATSLLAGIEPSESPHIQEATAEQQKRAKILLEKLIKVHAEKFNDAVYAEDYEEASNIFNKLSALIEENPIESEEYAQLQKTFHGAGSPSSSRAFSSPSSLQSPTTTAPHSALKMHGGKRDTSAAQLGEGDGAKEDAQEGNKRSKTLPPNSLLSPA